MSAQYWSNITRLDMFTLQHIFEMVSSMDIYQFDLHENKTPYAKGENYAYRAVMGELSRLIEHKKTSNKEMKERTRRLEHMKGILERDNEREKESLK